jgi:cyclase
MLRSRVIPVLLLKGRGLYKTVTFKDPKYVGDPINTLRIFCEKEVDEVVVLDIGATPEGRGPAVDVIRDIASECFMPLAYGGGITSVDQVRKFLNLGVEKVVLNTAAVEQPELISRIAAYTGSSSVVVSIDVRRRLLGGYEVYTRGGRQRTELNPVTAARQAEKLGAGEIMINSIDRDGTMQGYDLPLIEQVVSVVGVPVIACGGAGNFEHLRSAIAAGANAAGAGSMFVFQGKHRAVLISYPTPAEVDSLASAMPGQG